MSAPPPVSGITHHLVLKYNNDTSSIGLMLPDGDLSKFIVQPYTPFAPQSRQGEKKIEDFSVATVWELQNDFSGGTGHSKEGKVESSAYAYCQGNNVAGGLGTTLFTAQKGKLLPAPAHVEVTGITSGNVIQYIEHDKYLYAMTDENPGKIYKFSGSAQFNGTNEYLSLASNATIQTGAEVNFAWCGWVWFDSLPTTEVVFLEKSGEYRIGKNALQQFYFKAGSHTNDVATDTATVIKTKQWYFIAAWKDTTANKEHIQVNNGAICFTSEAQAVSSNGNALAFGSVTGGGSLFFKGRMASWAFYKDTLPTASVLTTLYNSGSGLKYANTTATERTGLVAWWDLDETSGTRVADYGSSVDLTDNNTVTFSDGIPVVAGTVFSLVETLSSGNNTRGIQMHSDGATLRVTRGSTQPVRKSANGNDWADDTDTGNTSYIAIRNGGTISRITGASLSGTNDNGSGTATIGWAGTSATMMEFLNGSLVIGKPEGLFTWKEGAIEEIFPCHQAVDNVNFSRMTVHNNLLWFNVKNRLYFTDLQSFTEVYPEERGGFTEITCLTGTSGPLLIGAKWKPFDGTAQNESRNTPSSASQSAFGSPPFVDWSDITNALMTDNSRASCALTAAAMAQSQVLCITGFGFSIPTNAAILGIKAEIEGYTTASDPATDQYMNLDLLGVSPHHGIGGTLPTAEAYVTFGGEGNLWGGGAISAEEVNSSSFGIGIGSILRLTAPDQINYIDHVRITVYYNQAAQPQNCLFMLESVQDAGLNPLWTDADGSNPMYAAYATSAPDSNAARIYTSSDHAHWKTKYVDLDTRFLPKTYDTDASNVSYIHLTEFSAGFASIKKWWYQCVLNAVNPNQSTFARTFYSIDGANFTQTTDEDGNAVEHTLSSRNFGAYFPLNTTGTYNQLRLYLRTTSSVYPASISTVTLRGDVMVKPRFQFQFPIDCGQTVKPMQGADENGHEIYSKLLAASQQGYPIKLQDPEGNWHLCLFQTSPYFSTIKYDQAEGAHKLVRYGVVMVVLEEIDPLASDGGFNAWSPG